MGDAAASADGIEQQWVDVIAEAQATKDPNQAGPRMAASYRSLSESDRGAADEVLRRWVTSGDVHQWHPAIALIRTCRIRTALPWLRQLADQLETDPRPSAPHEWKLVNGTIGFLVD
jgi:hypothetical protein